MPTKTCRVCFEEGTDLRELGTGRNSTGSKLSACVPEINVYIVENPTICRPCLCMVEVAYKLRETCLENEKRFNQDFDRNDFVTRKKSTSQVKKERTVDKEHQEKDVAVVFNDYFDESGVLNIDSKQILKTERNPDFPQPAFGNNEEMPICEVPQIKTEVFEPEESLLEISEEYITTASNESFISRTNSEGVSEYSCNMCNRSFTGMKYLKIHLNKMHYNIGAKKAKFECEICYKTFTTKGGVAMHSKSCRNIKKLKNKYSTNSVVQEVSESVSDTAKINESELPPQNNDTFTCEKCLKIFTTRASFRVHSKNCSEEFLDETELNIENVNPLMMATKTVIDDPMASKTHEDYFVDSSDGVDSDYDPDSPDADSDGSDFSIGRRKRKSRGRNSWGITSDQYKRRCVDLQIQCEKCSRTFMTRAAFSNHSKSCTSVNVTAKQTENNESQNPEQKRDTLVTEFINMEGSKTVKSEDGKTEHICKICDEKCSDQKILEEHVSKHIDVSAAAMGTTQIKTTKAITCCGKEYTTVSLLQLHTYKEHGKSCGVCNKHFTSYNDLFGHLLEHTKQ